MPDSSKASVQIPAYTTDLIILSDVVTYSIPDGNLGTTTTYTYDSQSVLGTSIGQLFPIGIYTTDGGTSYNDLGNSPIGKAGTSYSYTSSITPQFTANARLYTDGTTRFGVTRESARSGTITISFAILAGVQGYRGQITSNAPFRGQKIAYTSASKYRQIVIDSFTNSSETDQHGLGTVPTVGYWTRRADGTGTYYGQEGAYNDPGTGTTLSMGVDSSFVYAQAGSSVVFYRLYYGS